MSLITSYILGREHTHKTEFSDIDDADYEESAQGEQKWLALGKSIAYSNHQLKSE